MQLPIDPLRISKFTACKIQIHEILFSNIDNKKKIEPIFERNLCVNKNLEEFFILYMIEILI